MNQKISSIVALSMVMASGCAKAPSSSSTVNASINMTGSSSAATVAKYQSPKLLGMLLPRALALTPPAMVDASGATVNLTQAWVVIKKIEFKSDETAGAGESDGSEVEFTGPYVVDLLSATPVTLDTKAIAQKSIRRIKMQLHQMSSLPTGAPSGLTGHSIYVTGTAGGNAFTYQSDDGTEIQIGGPTSFQPGEGSQLLIEIQVANIFKQINMSTVTANETISAGSRHAGVNLCPSIDASASDIYTCLRKGLELRANFGRDNDGDHKLGTSDDKVK